MIQGGDPTETGSGGPGYSIPDELNGDESYVAGTFAMANAGTEQRRQPVLHHQRAQRDQPRREPRLHDLRPHHRRGSTWRAKIQAPARHGSEGRGRRRHRPRRRRRRPIYMDRVTISRVLRVRAGPRSARRCPASPRGYRTPSRPRSRAPGTSRPGCGVRITTQVLRAHGLRVRAEARPARARRPRTAARTGRGR